MTLISQALFLVATYFVCAIPFGLIVTQIFLKKDVRNSGSGNIGATNVTRIAGKKLGALTLILDGAKGVLMVIIGRFIFEDSAHLHLFLVAVSITAVLAHIYPIYLGFKGGKGVATSLAILLAIDPTIGFISILTWIIIFSIFRISAISSLVAIFSSIISSIYYEAPPSQLFLCAALFALILLRHKENIKRLLDGKENKM